MMLYMGMLLDPACMGMVLDAMGTLVLDDTCRGAGCYLQGLGCMWLHMVMLMLAWSAAPEPNA